MKTLNNTGKETNTPDMQVHGNSSAWVCVCKAWSKEENWMKSTKVMEVDDGCLVQVSTQQGDRIAEAITFVPSVSLYDFGVR